MSLPDRHFYWRVRSNALSFAYQHEDLSHTDFDLVVATSMVDLCNLRGLLPHLASVPAVLYFHENQFAYPTRNAANSNLINAQLTSVYSALCATRLVFNSHHNQETFLSGAAALFKKMPDGTSKDMLLHLPAISDVIPVPVLLKSYPARHFSRDDCIGIIWNHRWEYDKQPMVFFEAIQKLIKAGVSLKVHVMGQAFRESPDCFAEFKSTYPSHIGTWGYQSMEDYHRILRSAHIVVSAALHDFQGLGMLEAIQSGCTPVAPDRMAYPEYVPPELLYSVGESIDAGAEAEQLFKKLFATINAGRGGDVDITRYNSELVMPLYQQLFSRLALQR